jgi:seryl-tRNA synthetase
VISLEKPTAVSSFNYHGEKFGSAFGIMTHDGQTAHTACLGFGLERVVMALFRTHGYDPKSWPASVRARLWP